VFTSKTRFDWTAPGGAGSVLSYDVAGGSLGEWPVGSGASESCVDAQETATEATIAETPDPDTGRWYLVRARTACGLGTYGFASDGSQRNVTACP